MFTKTTIKGSRFAVCALFFLTLFIVVATSSATPHELLFQPGPEVGKDALVDSWPDYCDTNFGDSDALYIFATTLRLRWSYVEFAELEPYVGSGYECLNATLSLYWVEGNPGPAPWLCVYRAAGPWEEDTITWNNQPGCTGDPCVYPGPPPEEVGWVDIDCVTEFVDGWFSGEYGHYGFVIRLVDENHGYGSKFWSSDNVRTDKPKLYVKYQCTAVEPASLGGVKAVYR